MDSAVNHFLDALIAQCEEYTPHSKLVLAKSTHPWLDLACEAAINKKNEAMGTPDFLLAQAQCAECLNQKHKEYIVRLKAKLAKLSKSDRQWWRLNRELLNRKAKITSVPPLKDDEGSWRVNSQDKANLLANKFSSKSKLPPEVEDQFVPRPEVKQNAFFAIRTRSMLRCLQKLDVSCATGPDRLAARILRELAVVLALPLTILCRRILYEANWPTRWRVHLVIPIYKKAAVSDPGNYRGIHLTSIVSKCVERVIGQPLIAFLEAHGFGSAQWAFRKKCSARDLSLVCVSRWI